VYTLLRTDILLQSNELANGRKFVGGNARIREKEKGGALDGTDTVD
jgi:hypothetical protein